MSPFTLFFISYNLDFFIGKSFFKLNYVVLANIFFEKMTNKKLHSEFLQNEVSVENLLKDYKTLNRDLFFENSKLLRVYLKHGSSRNVASIIKN